MVDEKTAQNAKEALHDVPQAAETTYGKADLRFAQASMADLRDIKAALLDPQPKPDHEGAAASVVAGLLVAYDILHTSASGATPAFWHAPTSGVEVLVLIAVVVNAYLSVTKCIRAYRPTSMARVALGHVNDMIAQVQPVTDGAEVPRWWHFLNTDVARSIDRSGGTPPAGGSGR